MPRDLFGPDHAFLPRAELLTFEEITRVVGVFASLGVTRCASPGASPCCAATSPTWSRIACAGGAKTSPSPPTAHCSRPRRSTPAAGLHRVTVSLDSLDPAAFQALSDTKVPLQQVLAGIDAACPGACR